ncbi:hypothetical protein [Haloactinospora alba]|nr:hypothetical protein [Haloactinospora alba]
MSCVEELTRRFSHAKPRPPYGDGLDDVRAELSPLVRQWVDQHEANTVRVVR